MRPLTAELSLKEELHHSFYHNHWNSVFKGVVSGHLVGHLKRGDSSCLDSEEQQAEGTLDLIFEYCIVTFKITGSALFNKHVHFYKFMPELLKQESKSSQPLPNSLNSCMHVKIITINCFCLLNPKINRPTTVTAFNVSGEPRIDSLLWRERFEICWPWYRREQDGNYWAGEWVSYLFVILIASAKTVWTIGRWTTYRHNIQLSYQPR